MAKLYEVAAAQNPTYLLNVLNTVGGCVDIAQKLVAMEQPELAQTYLDILEFFTKALSDEAVVKPTGGIGSYLTDLPQSLQNLNKQMGITTVSGSRANKRQIDKLVKDGVAQQIGRKYRLYPRNSGPTE